MKEIIENEEGKSIVKLYPSDWRYSASIVGLSLFFDYSDIEYKKIDNYIEYEQLEIDDNYKEKYLLFVEEHFSEYMHHKVVENLLGQDELSDDDIKKINEKLSANTVMGDTFAKIKFSRDDLLLQNKILELINNNRLNLIEKTFATGDSLYAKFSHVNKKNKTSTLFSIHNKVCRLNGYYEDMTGKAKSLSYNWDKDTFAYEDEIEFDFIPFAFTKTRESFFINSNISISELIKANKNLHNELKEERNQNQNPRKLLFHYTNTNVDTNLEYNVEIITTNMIKVKDKYKNSEYFETVFVRKNALEIFKKLSDKEYECLIGKYYLIDKDIDINKVNNKENYRVDIQKIVTDSILNNIHLDNLIEKLLKFNKYPILQSILIKINSLIYGGGQMDKKIYMAMKTAYDVVEELEDNKLKSYKHKLISAITFNDYDKFCKILLQLSDYSGVIFNFAYDLFDDFDGNKNQAYAFINGLNGEKQAEKNDKNTDNN